MKNSKNNLIWSLMLLVSGIFAFSFVGCEHTPQESDEAVVFNGISLKSSVQTDDCTKSVCLVAGQHQYVGTVDVGKAQGDLYVTYNITEPGIYLKEIHLDIFASLDQFAGTKKLKNGSAVPGQFEFKHEFDKDELATTFTVVIPADYIEDVLGEDAACVFVASHASLSNGETAWGGICEETDNGVTLDFAKQFPGKNWSVFFEFCFEECRNSIDFTYAWEDLKKDGPDGNDGDYNDLVIQSDVMKSDNQLLIDFFATARGAAYDHAFKIKLLKDGILKDQLDEYGIIGAESVEEDGDYLIITVFSSTKTALPAEEIAPYQFAVNTVSTDDNCLPYQAAQIVILIDGNAFPFDSARPYDPFITVHPGQSNSYDLNIWELHKNDGTGSVWLDGDGKKFPNGIIISDDWLWPLEKVNIKNAYPDFSDIGTNGENWNADWANNLGDASKVFMICDYE